MKIKPISLHEDLIQNVSNFYTVKKITVMMLLLQGIKCDLISISINSSKKPFLVHYDEKLLWECIQTRYLIIKSFNNLKQMYVCLIT